MGFLREGKAANIAHTAKQEWDAGGRFFTPILAFPMTQVVMTGGVSDWSGMLMGIEDVGWKLHTWAVCTDAKGRPMAMPLFGRS